MGRTKLSIENGSRHTHFTWDERIQLQYYYCGTGNYQKKRSPKALGVLLGKHESTIRRELKRGMVVHEMANPPFEKKEYNADYAQNDAKDKASAKGPELKLGRDWALVKRVTNLIKKKKYSPYAVIEAFNQKGWPSKTRICEKTLYNYIAEGYMGELQEEDLLYAGRRRKKKGGVKRHSRAANAAKSISKRPKAATDRSEFGHWEIDTVVSGVGTSPTCLLTLTERKTRFEIVRKIEERTMDAVTREIDILERQIGVLSFRRMFKTVTGDNGSEFSDIAGLERSAVSKQPRLSLFFAHPYSSFERGTNENHNGIIRRFIPKGVDIGDYSKQVVRATQDWMNSYPRKILKGLTPLMALRAELGSEFRTPGILEVKT